MINAKKYLLRLFIVLLGFTAGTSLHGVWIYAFSFYNISQSHPHLSTVLQHPSTRLAAAITAAAILGHKTLRMLHALNVHLTKPISTTAPLINPHQLYCEPYNTRLHRAALQRFINNCQSFTYGRISEHLAEEILNPSNTMFIARTHKKIFGALLYKISKQRKVWIEDLFLAKKQQNDSTTLQLINYALDNFRSQKGDVVSVAIDEDENPQSAYAKSLFTKAGFIPKPHTNWLSYYLQKNTSEI
jgi:hypothetical protein